MNTAEEIVASSAKLVTFPPIFHAVKKVIDDPQSTAVQLSRVISTDPAMTAQVLKLVNSAFWGYSRQIDSLARAVSLLGMIQVHDLVLATSVVETFASIRPELMSVAKFWKTSLSRSLAATALARRGAVVDLGRVFTEALMSDLGHMVLYSRCPELAAKAMEQSRGMAWELPQIERALIGCDFAQVGGAMTDVWQLPPCFGEAIRHQNEPAAAGSYTLEASLLHIAARLAVQDTGDGEFADSISHIAPFAWQTVGLTEESVPQIIADIESGLSSTARTFGIPL